MKAETRARVQAVCEHVGASDAVCDYMQVILWREAFGGHAGVWHDGGRGLGPMGLNLRWHRDKWPGPDDVGKRRDDLEPDDEHPMFCVPEVSALVALEIMHRAVRRWNARNLVGVNAVFAGRMRTHRLEDGTALRVPGQAYDAGLCARLDARGVRCLAPITARDLGRRVPYSERRELALDLHEAFGRVGEAT